MVSKESAQVLLSIISNINISVTDQGLHDMQALLKARDELREVLEPGIPVAVSANGSEAPVLEEV